MTWIGPPGCAGISSLYWGGGILFGKPLLLKEKHSFQTGKCPTDLKDKNISVFISDLGHGGNSDRDEGHLHTQFLEAQARTFFTALQHHGG